MWELYVMNWGTMRQRIDRFLETEDAAEFLVIGENPMDFLRLIEDAGRLYKAAGDDARVKVLRAHWRYLNGVIEMAAKLYSMDL